MKRGRVAGSRPVAIVTGAGRPGRVGLATAAALAQAECDLVLTVRDGKRPRASELPAAVRRARVRWETVDLADAAGAERWARRLAKALGRVDVLVHNASVYEATPIGRVKAAGAVEHYTVNALSPLLISQALAERLAESPLPGGGAIVAMCDIHAMGEAGQARRDFAAYGMSKAALLEMVMVLARGLAPKVRVNAVAPGVVAFGDEGPDADPAARAAYLRRVPLGRSGTPEEAAAAVRWLALEATYCTGQVVRVDGGRGIT